LKILKSKFIESCKESYKRGGVKALIEEKGLKVVVILFLFFSVKGSLYIIIPWLGLSYFSTCF